MNARDELMVELTYERGTDDLAAELIDAFRAEVLREAANALSALGPADSLVSGPKAWNEAVDMLRHMADGDDGGDERPSEPTIYRASHGSIVMGLYTTREAARAHCEAEEHRQLVKGSYIAFGWIPDDSDPLSPEELSVFGPDSDDEGPEETVTGYVVTPLTVASEYDEETDE